MLNRAGNTYARIMLGLSVRDATAGYRVYRAAALAGFAITEAPIRFRERECGLSKMSRVIVIEALLKVTGLSFTRRVRRNPSETALPLGNA